MKNSQLKKVIKAVINKNSVLPILENVLIKDGKMSMTDLETYVQIPYEGPECCFYAEHFISALNIMESPTIEVDKLYNINIKENKRRIGVTGEDWSKFPAIPVKDEDLKSIGSFNQEASGYLETALKFVSNDDLRPLLTGIHLGKEIAATDAHRLFWKAIKPLKKEFTMPAKTARILLAIGGEWKVFFDGANYACFINQDGVSVYFRCIEGIFPNYQVVIPEGEGNVVLSVDPKELRSEIKNAMQFANKATNQVTFSINGSVKIYSCDVEFGFEYSNEVVAQTPIKKQDLQIGFNGKFLDQILSELDKGEKANIKLLASEKAAIINERFLLMPLMLNK